jgi:hypothetical protein
MLSNLLSRLHSSGSSQGTTSQNAQTSTTSAANATESASCGHTLSDLGSTTSLLLANQPATKRMVLQTAITKLFNAKHFSICDIDAMLDVLDVSRNSEAYALLRTLHCIDYTEMPSELKRQLPQLVNEALTANNSANNQFATDIALKNVRF